MERIQRPARYPTWVHILQIAFGAFSVAMSLVALMFPGLAVTSVVVIISAILLVAGIEQIASGMYRKQRATQIGIGVLDIALAIAAIVFPLFAALVIIALAAFALLFSGISSVLVGISNKHEPTWERAVNIGAGALSIVIAIFALISPLFGAFLVASFMAVALLFYGMRLIAIGISGQRGILSPTASRGNNVTT